VSISPSSDIVLGVAKAADPKAYCAAVERLMQAAEETPAASSGEFTTLTETRKAPPARASDAAPPSAQPASSTFTGAVRKDQTGSDPYKEFEAFFLQTFVEAMLPKEAESLFGSGPAGAMWKSMLAEHMAREIANGTSFGIAETIAAHRTGRATDQTHAPALGMESGQSSSPAEIATRHLTGLQKVLSAEGALAAGQSDGLDRPVRDKAG